MKQLYTVIYGWVIIHVVRSKSFRNSLV